MNLELLDELQHWFETQCDGRWEHEHGMRIETLDNPGWSFEADVSGTELDGKRFEELEVSRSDRDWVTCRVEGARFEGFGGTLNLEEILKVFLQWAKT